MFETFVRYKTHFAFMHDTPWNLQLDANFVWNKVVFGASLSFLAIQFATIRQQSSSGEVFLRVALTDKHDRTSSSGRCTSSLRAWRHCDDASGVYVDWRFACTCSGIGDRRIFVDHRTRSARVLPSCASASISSHRQNTGGPDLQSCRNISCSFWSMCRSSRARRAISGRKSQEFPGDESSRKNLKNNIHALINTQYAKRESHRDLLLVLLSLMESSEWPWKSGKLRYPQIQIFRLEERYLAKHYLHVMNHTYVIVTFCARFYELF